MVFSFGGKVFECQEEKCRYRNSTSFFSMFQLLEGQVTSVASMTWFLKRSNSDNSSIFSEKCSYFNLEVLLVAAQKVRALW